MCDIQIKNQPGSNTDLVPRDSDCRVTHMIMFYIFFITFLPLCSKLDIVRCNFILTVVFYCKHP